MQRVTSDGEQDLTNGLIKVIQGTQHKVYFTQGHGERDTGGSDERGYGAIAEELGSDNFTAETLVLAAAAEFPADASVLVIAGPQSDLLRAGDREAQGVSREGRQAARPARSAAESGRAAADQPARRC